MARATRPAPELGDDLWTYAAWSKMGGERRVAKAAQDWVCSLNAMDTLGFEPRAFRMRSGCDTTTPCALKDFRSPTKAAMQCLFSFSPAGAENRAAR